MKNAGRQADPAEGNRTTSSNVWKPPEADGTTSQQRALRWQEAASAGQEESSPDSPSPDDSRSEKSTKSGSTNRTNGTSRTGKSSSKSSRKEKKRAGQEAEKSKPKEPGDVDWYGDPLKPGIEASLGPGGSLYSFTAKGKTRAGMCNPPMNPVVRAALMADLNEWKVAPIVKKKKGGQDDDDGNGEKRQTRQKIVLPAAVSARSLEDDAALQAAGDPGSTGPAGGLFGGSAESSRMSSPGPSAMRRTASTPHPYRGGSPFVKSRKKKGDSAWQLDLSQEGKHKKPGLDTAPEGEVKWRTHNLKRTTQQHGFVLEKMDVGELGQLSTYHNSFSRGSLSHPALPLHPVPPVGQLKDLSKELHSTSHSLQSLSDVTVQSEFSPSRRMPRKLYNTGPSQESPSMERLLEMAQHVKHTGPHKLQSMCQNARISVHTGQKLPDERSDIAGAEGDYIDDPLFGDCRPGITPRTSTGKALPVPYWGRNGSAPVLRESPEIRQARAAVEASR